VIYLTKRDENGKFVHSDPMTQAILRYRENRPGMSVMRALIDLDCEARREEANNANR
jgi:hypothetical protein